MTTLEECKGLILARAAELIPSATASTLPKIAMAVSELTKNDHLDNMMQSFLKLKPVEGGNAIGPVSEEEVQDAHI